MSWKQVLMVAYLFPPIGGDAVQRPLKFARYLRDYGWEPIVLTTQDAAVDYSDPALLEQLPEDLEVIRRKDPIARVTRPRLRNWGVAATSAREENVSPQVNPRPSIGETWFKSLLRNIRKNLLIPDESLLWSLRAVVTGKRTIDQRRFKERPIDCVYTVSGPHSTHLVGLLLKRWTRVKWVADLGSPWTQDLAFSHTGLRARIEEWLECQVLTHADAVVTVTEGFAGLLRAKYPKHVEKLRVILNGVDVSDFPAAAPRKPTERLKLVYGGSLQSKHSPAALFQALNAGLRYGKIKPNQISLQFAGVLDPPGEMANHHLVGELNLHAVVEVLGNQTHSQVLQKLQEADAFLLIGSRTGVDNPYVEDNLYRYLCFDKPVLALLEQGEAARLLQEADTGTLVNPGDMGAILTALLTLLEEHQRRLQGAIVTRGPRRSETVGLVQGRDQGLASRSHLVHVDYTRQGQTSQLARVLQNVTQNLAPHRGSARAPTSTRSRAHV